MAHTPGPWTATIVGDRCRGIRPDYHNHDGDNCFDFDRAGFTPCPFTTEIVTTDGGYYGPRADDARLIAAAPDMLEALVMVRDADDDHIRDGGVGIPWPARERIDAAIAKATGF